MTDPLHFTDPAWSVRESRRQALEEAANALDLRRQDILLIAGEMTAQEIRSVRAMLNERARFIRGLALVTESAATHEMGAERSGATPALPASDRDAVIEECAVIADRFQNSLMRAERAHKERGLQEEASILESRAVTALGIAGTIRSLKSPGG